MIAQASAIPTVALVPDRVDVAIVGSGPVGAALALALSRSGISAVVLEARETPGEDPRALALSYGSALILKRIGVWSRLGDACPITAVHVSQKESLGRVMLASSDAGVPALGYVVNYRDLSRAVGQALRETGLPYLTGAQVVAISSSPQEASARFVHDGVPRPLAASLLAVADGGNCLGAAEGRRRERVRDYGQWAVVAEVKAEKPPSGIAYERFTPGGPVALLPFGAGYALVWTACPELAQELLALGETEFLERLHRHFGDRAGRFTEVGKRAGFPLRLRYARSPAAERIVLLGNAAHTLHPVAGQGLNLGLRDAWELAQRILEGPPSEIGSRTMLARYVKARRLDVMAGIGFTDFLVRIFSNDHPLLAASRSLGLLALDCWPQAKRFLARRMIFGPRGLI